MKCANCENEATLVDNTPSVNSVVYCVRCAPKSVFITPIPAEPEVVEEVEKIDDHKPSTGKTGSRVSTDSVQS